MPADAGDGLALSVADLTRPLSSESFVRDHWASGEVFVSEPSPTLVERLGAFPSLREPRALVAALAARPVLPNHIRVFGPRGFRSEVPASRAMDFYRAGFTLYMHGVEEVVPDAARLFAPVYAELGFVPRVYLEAFAATAGSVSTWHYDHDINFQILLHGQKEWLVAPNHHIRNPIRSFHPVRGDDGALGGFTEEVYARDPEVPCTPVPDCRRISAAPGSVVFLPRAWWHEVHARTDCFGLNVVIKGRTWAAAIAEVLQHRLEASEELRGYVSGLATARTLDPIVEAMQRSFPAIKAIAERELSELTLDEVPLAEADVRLRWAPAARVRRLAREDEGWHLHVPELFDHPVDIDDDLAPFVTRLVALRGPFTWSQVIALRGDLHPTHLRALLETLKNHGVLELAP